MKTDIFLGKLIGGCFGLLFFLTPLFFTSVNSELFEFNKIILVYAFTVLIAGAWAGRMIIQKRIIFKKTPLFIPLVLFLISQILSTVFSIDRHTSIFGYYSRFNGGLLSTINYLLLYWAIVSNCEPKNIIKFLKISLVSAGIVSVYGILEHFGHSFSCFLFTGQFNVGCWIQDVKTRVFATIGQPNWLSAYLAILIPIILSFSLKDKFKTIVQYFLFIILYSCLLFTGSRSGFAGLAIGMAVFFLTLILTNRHQLSKISRPIIQCSIIIIFLTFVFGSPFSPSFTKPLPSRQAGPSPSAGPQLEVGGTESGQIRKIVWKGAVEIFRHYPLFGSGVETFAYSYYRFRPMEHNLVSEWDFLYNKAHNEYLNYLSTTGAVGTAAYLLFILSFVFWYIKKADRRDLVSLALFSGWLSILVSNFFGFSVVLTSLYFFLIPAFVFVLSQKETQENTNRPPPVFFLLILLLAISYSLFAIVQYWHADYYYSLGEKYHKNGQPLPAYQNFLKASQISPREPLFLSDLSSAASNLVLLAFEEKDASATGQLTELSVRFSDRAVSLSPNIVNYWKTRTKVFYTLSQIDEKYLAQTIESLESAIKLSPTDPKLILNLGLIYGKLGKTEEFVGLLQRAVQMKPNYEEARLALGTYYEAAGDRIKALEQLEYISRYIRPNDEELKTKIKNLSM